MLLSLRYLSLVCLLVSAGSLLAFQVQNSKELQASLGAEALIVSEALQLLDGNQVEAELLQNPQYSQSREADGRLLQNIYGSSKGIRFRREVSAAADGSEIELAYMAHCGAYSKEAEDKLINYEIRLPLAVFAGSQFVALTGRSSRLSEHKGSIAPNANGRIVSLPIRQIAFSGGKLGDLVIDCNPKGVNTHGDYPPNAVVGLWDLKADGKHLILSRIYAPKFFGGMIAAHMVFYRGKAEDFNVRHTTDAYPYFSDWKAECQYVFGAAKFGEQYVDAGTAKYDPAKKFGWLDNQALSISSYKNQGAFYSAVKSNAPATFRREGLRRGLHVVTLVSGTGWQEAGPFTLLCKGEKVAENLRIEPKTVHTLAFPVWLDDGVLELSFQGNWQLSTINTQLLQTCYEDYTFRRGFWRDHKVFEPSPMFNSASYAQEPPFSVSISKYPLPEPGEESPGEAKTWELPHSHAVFAPGKDWRGRANIGSIGPSNNGTFTEFDSPELIQRRLTELKNDNLNVVLINGFLSRHTYATHLQRTEQNIADFVKAGKSMGFTFLDHQDHSLLWDMDSGFRFLVGNMPYLQQSVDGQLSVRGLCPSNPQYFRIFADYVLNHVKKTGIDGIMIDEVSFHGLKFCGCAQCRMAFTADTGWHLPADECSPELFNRNSKLWRTWLRWRQKRLGDFWYKLKEEIRPLRPDFVCMGYSTHYGMTSTYGSLTQGGALEQSTRGWDFVGTEIMTRNIFANYRSVMSLRQAKGQFAHSSGLPVFGLVYTAVFDWDLSYFGWALNNLLAQATWEMTGKHCPPDKSNYLRFTKERGNIDLREARSLARVALLFSNQSRDWPRSTAYPPDVLGISQLLNLKHIAHVFINENGLRPEVLDNYDLLIVSNAMALSDQNLEAIKAFAFAGGRVYLSNRVAQSNENGDTREAWPFPEIFNLQRLERASRVVLFKGLHQGQKTEIKPEEPLPAVQIKNLDAQLASDWLYTDPQGNQHQALYQAQYGKGRFYYSPLLIGVPANATEIRTDAEFVFVRQEQSESIGQQILAEIVQDSSPWTAVDVPEAVLTAIYEDQGETVLHFLNATGSQLQPGQMVPVKAPEVAFPPLSSDIRFVLPLNQAPSAAYAVSPDFQERKPISFKRLPQGGYEFTLPASHLQAYTLVRIKP